MTVRYTESMAEKIKRRSELLIHSYRMTVICGLNLHLFTIGWYGHISITNQKNKYCNREVTYKINGHFYHNLIALHWNGGGGL